MIGLLFLVLALAAVVVAVTRWLTRKPKGRHHRPDGESAHRPLLALTQRHKPRARAEILPGLEVATP